jgi:hypothetical protein
MERSIYNNMSEADRRAIAAYLVPLLWHRDQELTQQLLRDFDSDESHFIESDLSEVAALQESADDLVNRAIAMYQGQIITRSEARLMLDYESDPSGADDVYLVKAGTETVTIEQEEEMRMNALEPPEPQMVEGQIEDQQPLQLVKGRHSGLLKGAPQTIKQLYSAK